MASEVCLWVRVGKWHGQPELPFGGTLQGGGAELEFLEHKLVASGAMGCKGWLQPGLS